MACSILVFNVPYVLAYFVIFAQQLLQWMAWRIFHSDIFFPLLDDVLGLLIKVDVGAKRYREQLSNLL